MVMRRRPAMSAYHAARRETQDRRIVELADLRLQRRLTDDELAEEDRLTRAIAHRVWRQQQAETQQRIDAAVAAQVAREHTKEAA